MKLINNNMKWIMLISGLITFSMIFAAINPQLTLNSMFGSNIEGALAEVVVRNWGALIALIGGMLIYGAYKEEVRSLVLSVAALSKVIFIILVISNGFGAQLFTAITLDAVFIITFITYLFTSKTHKNT